MLIVGARQVSSTKERLLGSVAQQIIQRAPISVLVAKKPVTRLECLLACTGGASVSEAVIRVDGRLAAMADAHITLLHVVGPVPSMYTGFNEIEETVERNCDLVIIGASGTAGRLSQLLMGNVTRQIVEHAPCAVLVASQTLQNSITPEHDGHSDA